MGQFTQARICRLSLLSGQDTCEGILCQPRGNSWTRRYPVWVKDWRICPEGWKGIPGSQNKLSVDKNGIVIIVDAKRFDSVAQEKNAI